MGRESRRSPLSRRALVGPPAVLLAALAAGVAGCGESRSMAREETAGAPRPVRTAIAVYHDGPARLTYAGEVVAANRYDVASKTMGNIVEMPIAEGTRVTRGDLIARIDAPELTSALGRARAAESAARTASMTAQRHAGRYRRLAAEGVVTPRDLELAEIDEASALAIHEAAKAELVVAERNMAYAEIRAPIAGVVVDRHVRLGDLATPGRPLAVLEDEKKEIRVSIPAELGPEVSTGDTVSVHVSSGGELVGRVDRVTPDASRHVRVVYVHAEDLAVPSGSFVTVGIADAMAAPRIVVPKEAMRRRGSLTSVFVAREGRAVLRYVRTDRHGHVVAGLEAGEAVVVAPPADLADGHPITVTDGEVPS